MSNKRHPDECPACERIPCRCAGGGGSDEEKSEKDKKADVEKRDDRSLNSTVNGDFILNSAQLVNGSGSAQTTLLDQENQLLYCTFFASTANRLNSASPDNLHDEGNVSNSENTSFGMGMKMDAVSE